MSTYNILELGKLDEKDFSAIAWLNNALRRKNVTENNRQLEEELHTISQSCTYTITDYNEQMESEINEIGSLIDTFVSKNQENSQICKELNSKINEFSNLLDSSEEKYQSNINIENILSLYEKKEKLETVSQILTNNSKFESLLYEIENVLQNKDEFILLIKEQGQEFHDIINKVCSLKLLVSSLESIPEFSARIQRYKGIEGSILNLLDNFFENKFINETIEENTVHDLILVYSKFGHDSRLYKKMIDIINEQIEQVWKLLWSLTTFGSQNRGTESDQFKKLSRKSCNHEKDSIIFLPAIEDLESTQISQDIFRIREDEAITRFFTWFSELIFSRNHIIDSILSSNNHAISISETIQSIIKKLLCICISDVQEFINIIVNSITSSKFIFPENSTESFEMDSDSIFEMDHDTISTIDVKEIRNICERIFKSLIHGLELVIIPNVNKQGVSSIISNHLNQDHINQISDSLLIQGNFVQSLLLCDIAWIFQSMKNISSNLKSLIMNQSPVSEYSSEIESKSTILADRIGVLLSIERFTDNSPQITLIPLEKYIIFFISIIDYSLRFFLENDLIYLLNPIQSSVRAQTLNLIKSIEKKQKNSNLLISSANVLDKDLLASCFAFHFSLMKTRKIFNDLLQSLIIRCKSIYCHSSAKNENSQPETLLIRIFHDQICFNQYSIFQRIQETISESLSIEIITILEDQESSFNQFEFFNKFGSQILISQILSDSIDIISQCCSYPTLAFFEGYNRLNLWSREVININNEIQNLKDSNLQSLEESIISIIENSSIQPCGPIVSIGEYLLNIVVTLESTCNDNPDMQSLIESENLIPELVKKVSYIVEDTYRRQIFEIEFLSKQGCLQLYVDSKYILNIFEILLLYHKSPESDESNVRKKLQIEDSIQDNQQSIGEVNGASNEIVSLNNALLMIISNNKSLESCSSSKNLVDWYNSIKLKIKNTEHE